MLSKELMQYIIHIDDKAKTPPKKQEVESLTKPLLYIVLKFKDKQA